MSNVAKVLKAEISRVSRKEAKGAVDPIAKSTVALKKVIAELRKRVEVLEKGNNRLAAGKKKNRAEPVQTPAQESGKVLFTPKSIRSLRSKLGLSQAAFAKLVGVTPYSVRLWETKQGALNLRDKTREALLSVIGPGPEEAKEKLTEGPTGRRARAPKTKKAG